MQLNGFPKEAIIITSFEHDEAKDLEKYTPHPMAPVNGKPFLEYLLKKLRDEGIEHFIISAGKMVKSISEYFRNEFMGTPITYSFDDGDIGSSRAIQNAAKQCKSNSFWVFYADRFADINLRQVSVSIEDKDVLLGMVRLKDKKRGRHPGKYKNIKPELKVKLKKEKTYIAAGFFLISKGFIQDHMHEDKSLSFARDILAGLLPNINPKYYRCKEEFIDLKVEEDYFRAQRLFTNTLSLRSVYDLDSRWTIFIDRDGVINQRILGEYISSIREFVFIPGALEGIASLSRAFYRIIVVTNQQGIGKGLISAEQVEEVNIFMVSEVEKYGGRIDQVYFCPDLRSAVPNCLKPNPDLAYRAKNDFPDIDFGKSIMIGDSTDDMVFGKSLGMKTVLIPTKQEEMMRYCSITVDYRISGLWEFI